MQSEEEVAEAIEVGGGVEESGGWGVGREGGRGEGEEGAVEEEVVGRVDVVVEGEIGLGRGVILHEEGAVQGEIVVALALKLAAMPLSFQSREHTPQGVDIGLSGRSLQRPHLAFDVSCQLVVLADLDNQIVPLDPSLL